MEHCIRIIIIITTILITMITLEIICVLQCASPASAPNRWVQKVTT